MGTQHVGLRDVKQGAPQSRLRLAAPLAYLQIYNSEKSVYDFIVPTVIAAASWVLFWWIEPRPPMFGADGLLKFTRDILIMGVPFMVGALAAVAMGSPGPHLDRRPVGEAISLHGDALTLRQFVCYLLGYLCFVSVVVLIGAVVAEWVKPTLLANITGYHLRQALYWGSTLLLFWLLASLTVTVFWALYFLTVIVNRK